MAELVGIIKLIPAALIATEFVYIRWNAINPPRHTGVCVLSLVVLFWRSFDPNWRLID